MSHNHENIMEIGKNYFKENVLERERGQYTLCPSWRELYLSCRTLAEISPPPTVPAVKCKYCQKNSTFTIGKF